MDVKSEFLNGDLIVEIYMKQLPKFIQDEKLFVNLRNLCMDTKMLGVQKLIIMA
jgi:hypothetical protein